MASRIDYSQNRKLYVGTTAEINVADGIAVIDNQLIIGGSSAGFMLDVAKSAVIGSINTQSNTTNFENKLVVKGKNNFSDGTTWYGDYGQILLSANTNMTSSARQFLITNALDNNKFAIVRSVDANTQPVVNSTANGVNSGGADFVIDNAGNVGIGTTTPDYKFEVQGIISSADSGLQKATFANDGNDLVLTANADATNVTAKMLFKSSGAGGGSVSEKMSIQGDGSVIIGSSAVGGNKTLRLLSADNAVNYDIDFQQDGTTNHGRIRYTEGASDLLFFPITGVAANLTLAFNGNSYFQRGNVGIGVTGPTGKLEIQRSQTTNQFDRDSFLRLHPTATTNSSGYTSMFFGTSTTNNYGIAIGGIKTGVGDDPPTGANPNSPAFSIRVLDDSVIGTEMFKINTTGSVKFNAYNSTNKAGTPTYLLGTDASGNVVKSRTGAITGAQVHSLPASGATARWTKFGTFTAAHGGQSIFIKIVTNNGYNSSISQNVEVYIRFKTSNGGSLDSNGFSGDSSYYTMGASGVFPAGNIKWVSNAAGTSASSYTLYVLIPTFTGNGGFYVSENSVGTWINNMTFTTDPGAASTTVMIPSEQFRVGSTDLVVNGGGGDAYFANSNVGIKITNPAVPLDVEGKIRSNDSNSADYLEIFCDGSVSGDSILKNTNSSIVLMSANGITKIKTGDSTNFPNASLEVFNSIGSVCKLNSNGDSFINGGRLGVGITLPQYKLDVAGQIRAQGIVNIGGLGVAASGALANVDINDTDVNGTSTTYQSNITFKSAGTVKGKIGKLSNSTNYFTAAKNFDGPVNIIAAVGGGAEYKFGYEPANNADTFGLNLVDSVSTSNSIYLSSTGNNNSSIFFGGYINALCVTRISLNQTLGTWLFDSPDCGSSNISVKWRQYNAGGYMQNMIDFEDDGDIKNINGSYGTISSDERVKENIVEATSKLDDILSLKVKNFNFIGDNKKQIGLIAQEVEEVFPSWVNTRDTRIYKTHDEDGNPLEEQGELVSGHEDGKSLKVGMEFAILTKAIQEQQEIIQSLKQRIEQLEN